MDPILSRYSFPHLLKSCGNEGNLSNISLLHHHIIKKGIESDLYIESSLVESYGKCGCLEASINIFERMDLRSVVSWGIMIACYVSYGRNLCAFHLFEKMKLQGLIPDSILYVTILKACRYLIMKKGSSIHSEIVRNGLEFDVLVAGSLVCMYARCGNMESAYNSFKRILNKNIVMWGAIISGYIQQGDVLKALKLYKEMRSNGINPNVFIMSSILKCCGMIHDLRLGGQIHDQIIELELESDGVLGNALVDMYSKCGKIDQAYEVFTSLPEKNVIGWGTVIAGYVDHGFNEKAINLFEEMQRKNVSPNMIIFSCILKAFGNLGSLMQGKLVHDRIIRHGNRLDDIVSCCLVDMYVKCGALKEGKKMLDGNITSIATWAVMISGYIEHGDLENALDVYQKLTQQGIKPSKVVFLCILKACSNDASLHQGILIHYHMVESGFETDVVLGSSLVHMYANCGSLCDAYKIFNELPQRDVVLWGAMIHGHVKQGHDLLSLELFERMQKDGMKPNEFIFPCIIKACRNLGALVLGRLVHDLILRYEYESDIAIGNSLIEMYTRFCSLPDVLSVIIKRPIKDAALWRMWKAYVSLECDDKLLEYKLDQTKENCRTYDFYHQIVDYNARNGDLVFSMENFNQLINILGHEGQLGEAKYVLQTMPHLPDAIGWTSLLMACQMHGQMKLGRHCFRQLTPLVSHSRGHAH